MTDYLWLKWGTLKEVAYSSERARVALERYYAGGVSMSAMLQKNSIEQKQALCDLIDAIDGDIIDAWTMKPMTKDEAKRYIMEAK
jgi:hypothetical protein